MTHRTLSFTDPETREPRRVRVRNFHCPTCGQESLTEIRKPPEKSDRFVAGIFCGLLIAGGIWFSLGFVWVQG